MIFRLNAEFSAIREPLLHKQNGDLQATNQRKAVGITELIEILGVKHQTIYEAIRNGRLSRCIQGKDRQRKFEIYSACLEWDLGREHSQLRDASLVEEALDSTNTSNQYPSLADSRQIKEYYESLNEQVLFLKQTEKLVDLAAVENDVFAVGRLTRDRLQEIPEKLRFHLMAEGISDETSDRIVQKLCAMTGEALLAISEFDADSLVKSQSKGDD